MSFMRVAGSLVLSLGFAACGGLDYAFPEVVAESEYIEYSTWADETSVCMDELLADLDQFVEETAAAMGTSTPGHKIRYVWVPESLQSSETWICSETALGCFTPIEGEPFVFSSQVDLYHELVHAVSITAFGRSHRVLEEGVAEYLGSNSSSNRVVEGFPARFTDVLDSGLLDAETYPLTLHYVGSMIEARGMDKFKQLMREVPRGADAEAFAAAHTAVYGGDFAATIAGMTETVRGRLWTEDPGCDGEPLQWGDGADFEATVRAQCGDGSLQLGKTVDAGPVYYQDYTLTIPTGGFYTLKATASGETTAGAIVLLENCPGTETSLIGSYDGVTGFSRLEPGLHRLTVGYPPGSEPGGEMVVKFQLDGDPAESGAAATVRAMPLVDR